MQHTQARVITVSDTRLRQRVQRLATRDRRGVSQMAKLLLNDQLDTVEKEQGLPPIEEALGLQAS